MTAQQSAQPRSGWLTGFLIYLGLSNAWWAYRYAETYQDLVSHSDPRFPHWPFLALAILAGLNIVGVVGLWFWQRWGLVLLGLVAVATLAVNLTLNVPVWASLGLGLISLGILIALIRPRWASFR